MSYLLECMCLIIGVASMFAKCDIVDTMSCFAVAALFNIAGNILYTWRKNHVDKT